MSKKKNSKVFSRQVEVTEIALLSEMTRLLGLLVRLNVQAMSANQNKTQTIVMLDSIGFGQTEIAGLVGTTRNTVNVTLYSAKKKKK
jgi:DNA-directed RNA polymerase specialized sigma24 family protein